MTRPLSIAMLSIHSSPLGVLGTRDTGGMSVYVRALAREMGRSGHRVDIFTRARHDHASAVTRLSANVRLVTLDIGAPAHWKKPISTATRTITWRPSTHSAPLTGAATRCSTAITGYRGLSAGCSRNAGRVRT